MSIQLSHFILSYDNNVISIVYDKDNKHQDEIYAIAECRRILDECENQIRIFMPHNILVSVIYRSYLRKNLNKFEDILTKRQDKLYELFCKLNLNGILAMQKFLFFNKNNYRHMVSIDMFVENHFVFPSMRNFKKCPEYLIMLKRQLFILLIRINERNPIYD